jgi:hypothetical protein
VLNRGQVGWLDRPKDEGTSILHVVSGEEAARLVLYAGQPQGTGSSPTVRSSEIRRRILSGSTPNTVPGNSCG